MKASPLPVELLASEDARRLATATEAARPIGADRFEFEEKRITVESHQAFREHIATPEPADPIDELVAELRRGKETA